MGGDSQLFLLPGCLVCGCQFAVCEIILSWLKKYVDLSQRIEKVYPVAVSLLPESLTFAGSRLLHP